MLPKLDGLSLTSEIRKEGKNTPVIILSAKKSVEDRIKGLQTGSDDCFTKPFSFSELLAGPQTFIRRANGVSEAVRLIVEGLTTDLLARELTRSWRRIDPQPRESSLLEYLMRNAGRVVSKTMIMEHVWDYNFDPQKRLYSIVTPTVFLFLISLINSHSTLFSITLFERSTSVRSVPICCFTREKSLPLLSSFFSVSSLLSLMMI